MNALEHGRMIKSFTLPSSWSPEPKEKKIEDFTAGQQPEQLTRASLEATIGDPLLLGIETYWFVKLPSTVSSGVTGFDIDT
jgi:hypothetical protein